MVFSEKADNLKLLPNYSHEHPALLSQMKAPRRSVARLPARGISGAALSLILTRPSDFRKARLKLKCERNVIAVVWGCTVELDGANVARSLTNSTSYFFRAHSADDIGELLTYSSFPCHARRC